jgi:hypothetical protein
MQDRAIWPAAANVAQRRQRGLENLLPAPVCSAASATPRCGFASRLLKIPLDEIRLRPWVMRILAADRPFLTLDSAPVDARGGQSRHAGCLGNDLHPNWDNS